MNVVIADRIKLGVRLVVTGLMVYALYVSKDHSTHVALWIGLSGYQAHTLFVLIDLPALVGKVLQLHYFTPGTRRVGTKLTYISGSLSLACNVGSGWIDLKLGAAAYGAFVVGMFLYLEYVLTKIKSASAVTRAKNAAPVAPTATPASPKAATKKCPAGCTCGKHNRTRAPKIPAAAPVSPGPMGPGPAGPSAADLDELVGAAAYI